MSWREISRLRELGTPRYWKRRQLYQRRAQSRNRIVSRVRRWLGDTRSGLSAGWQLLVKSLGHVLLAVIGVFVVEVFCWLVQLTGWGAGSPFFTPPAASLQESVLALVGAAVAIAATLLGLYYTTVGVIASTIYKSVPGDVRDLFIRERNSEAYLIVVILTIAGGIVVLVAGVLGYGVAGLTLAILGLLAALTCIGLVVVTKRLFDFFDPSKLSATLLKQIWSGIRIATNPKTRSIARRQSAAHYETYQALASFRHLVEMLEDKELRNATAPVDLTNQLLTILRAYSSWKYTIPTDSNWWDRVPKHQNWLTIDHSRLQLALNTSVGSTPELQPDYLWLENTVARLLRRSLATAFQSQAGANALVVSESVANLVANLTARLQIDEALAIETTWDKVVLGVTTSKRVAAVDADDYEIRLNQMAAAESLVFPLTQMLLGLSHAANTILERDLPAEFESAITNPDALYRGNLSTGTRQLLESFSAAIRRETQVEGRRITPAWWINHLAARSMAEALLATEAGVLRELQQRTTGQVKHFQNEGRADLAAVVGMASLELLHKIEFHEPIIRRAEEKLASFRNANTSIDQWPERPDSPVSPTDEHTAMLEKLSELLPALRTVKFDPREPDLYGQLYQFVVDGAFKAILAGDRDRGIAMYAAALAEMDPARFRILADLARQEPTTATIYAVEPIITAMDLAGYALLMHELDGDGIWTQVKAMWDRLLNNHPEVAQFLLTAAAFVDGTFAMTVGGIERSRRSIELNQIFESRNISQPQWRGWDSDDEDPRPHPSPIVSAFAPRGYGMQDDLYALFIAEYLKSHLPPDADLGHKAKRVIEQIARYRPDSTDTDGDGEVRTND